VRKKPSVFYAENFWRLTTPKYLTVRTGIASWSLSVRGAIAGSAFGGAGGVVLGLRKASRVC